MPKISIVTPIYNSEQYLRECIESILSQTFQDYELILVDDGSTDSSGSICDEYAKKDSRIKVLHKENAGMGVSYNVGIDTACGEYIGFIESDDFAQNNMYEDLYKLAEQHNKPDIVKSAWFKYFTSSNCVEKDQQLTAYNSWDKFSVQNHPWLLLKQFSVWSAIYRTEFIKSNNIRYLETPGASYQDVGFTYKAFCLSSNIVVTPNAYIYYRQDNENSSINSKEKSEVIFWEYDEVDRFFKEKPEIKEWANTTKLIKQYYDYSWNYHRIANPLKPDFLKRFASDFKKYRDNGELNDLFYSEVNANFLNDIMSLV